MIFSRGQVGNDLALVQMMAWGRTGEQPLSKPMVAEFFYAYMSVRPYKLITGLNASQVTI